MMKPLIVRYPIALRDLAAIEAQLRGADLFRTSFDDLGAEVYSAHTYQFQQHLHATETRLLCDRNIFTRWIGLVKGALADPSHKLAAAVLCFAQCANISIEPNLAHYEVSHGAPPDEALEELRLFRTADNLDPRLFADVALGRSHQLPVPTTRTIEGLAGEAPDLAMPLRRWRTNYVFALAIASLELQELSNEARMAALIDWMRDDFIFGATALVFAMHYWSPTGRKRGMFKRLRSSDRQFAIRGIRNATWDLNLVTDWSLAVQRQRSEPVLWVLCSKDASVRRLAADLLSPEGPGIDTEVLAERLFRRYWGRQSATRLFARAKEAWSVAAEPSRRKHGEAAMVRRDALIQVLQDRILAWLPPTAAR
jgi:hypothetical protein